MCFKSFNAGLMSGMHEMRLYTEKLPGILLESRERDIHPNSESKLKNGYFIFSTFPLLLLLKFKIKLK